MAAFADLGLTSAAVRRAATEVGVSSAYLFRLFGSQREYFLACLDYVQVVVVAAIDSVSPVAGQSDPVDPRDPLGMVFREVVADGSVTGLWLQACAVARHDEEIARRCRRLMATCLRAAAGAAGVGPDRSGEFLARGTLLMTLQAVAADLRAGSEGGVAGILDEFG